MTLTTLLNLEGMINMMEVLKFKQMSNQLLKKSLLFTLHYVKLKFI